MNYNRNIINTLSEWRKQTHSKPVVLRGARQVGKTTVVKKFAEQFKHYIYLNLERTKDRMFFDTYEDVDELLPAILLQKNIPTDLKNTLLFIDEIQEVPQAIKMLRYFYEEYPELHVITAGSLLEFAMGNVESFPVGRVHFMYMFPLNFEEFLDATGHSQALKALRQIPLSKPSHNTLKNLFHLYAIIGGMPEVIKVYNEKKSIADLPKIYEGIWSAYRNDVEKYAQNETEKRIIKHIMGNAHNYLDQRITFQNFGNSNYRSREVGEAFRALDEARVIQLIYPSTETHFPIKTDLKKKPRMQFLDTGLVNHSLKIQHELIGMKDLSDAFKGALIPHLIMQEVISQNKDSYHKPCFWVREKSQSSAEVDMLYSFRESIVPIEIKSGPTGKLRSLHQFMETCPHDFSIRFYGGEIQLTEAKTPKGKIYRILNLPYYLGTQIPSYIEKYFS